MPPLRVSILDPSATRKVIAELPDNIEVYRLIGPLVKRLGFPFTGQHGGEIRYNLGHTNSEGEEIQIDRSSTLQQAGVQNDDMVRLYTQMETVESYEAMRAGDPDPYHGMTKSFDMGIDAPVLSNLRGRWSLFNQLNPPDELTIQQLIDRIAGSVEARLTPSIVNILEEHVPLGGSDPHGIKGPLSSPEELTIQQLIDRITGSVEARLTPSIVNILDEHATTQAEREASRNNMFGQAVFGTPSDHPQFGCDIFVIMPFADEFKGVYSSAIIPVAKERNCVVKRADDFFSHHTVIDEIWAAIASCRVVIADCTGRNANVFYELGIAHTLGKPTILITQNASDVPFDIQSRRFIEYEDRLSGLEFLKGKLKESLELLQEWIDKPS